MGSYPQTSVNIYYGGYVTDFHPEQILDVTGARNSLILYQVETRLRESTIALKTDPSGPSYTPATALLATGFKTAIAATAGGIYSVSTLDTGVGLLNPLITAQGSGLGELSNPSALNIGPDGLLYVLDSGNNRIQTFDITTGVYRGGFSFPQGVTVFPTSLAISNEGHIYLGDGLGGGSVFDLDGDLLSTFHPPPRQTQAGWTAV